VFRKIENFRRKIDDFFDEIERGQIFFGVRQHLRVLDDDDGRRRDEENDDSDQRPKEVQAEQNVIRV